MVGALFVLATVASILGSLALGSVLDGSNYLIGVADHEASVVIAALLFLVAASSAFGTAFLLFPILRRHAEGLAAGYFGLRAFENVLYAASAVALLVMLSVSQTEAIRRANDSDIPLVGAALLALHDWSAVIGTLIFFALGSVILNSVLYRSRLVPRWLSAWGLVGAALAFLYGLIRIFVSETGLDSPYVLLAMPIAVQEMVFAGWLMTKGFERREVQLDRTPERLAVPTRVGA
jgi:uncharacterized membrane protein